MTANAEPIREPLRRPEVAERPRLVEVDRDIAIAPHVIERNLARRMIIGIAIAVPICAGLFAMLVALALRGSGTPIAAPVLMGAGIGTFAGCFWGFWFGIAASIREMEEAEARSRRRDRG
jgi:hypothetical protein